MSNEDNINKTADSLKTTVSNQLAVFMGLKEKNPKRFTASLSPWFCPYSY